MTPAATLEAAILNQNKPVNNIKTD